MTETATILRHEIERFGIIPFPRFMELALYCPNSGYYEQESQRVGRDGDFCTNVSIGALFAELLAFQFAQWLDALTAGQCQLIEAGAHDGQLASDILKWLKRHRPEVSIRIEYIIVEPSKTRQLWQRKTLDQFAGQVRWATTLPIPKDGTMTSIIFSNELLDAFPVRRLAWDRAAGTWFEWGVGIAGDRFIWHRMPGKGNDWEAELHHAGFEISPELKTVLPDGYIIEHCPTAAAWWRKAASTLHHGKLMAIDYGFTSRQLMVPERCHGTLRAYHRHRVTDDVLANPGDQDITCHVNFTHIQKTGEDVGLQTEALVTQSQFLTNIASSLWQANSSPGAPTPAQARQFQSLTHPEHFGHSFRVLVQSRSR